jgi:hypothetical protein
MSAAAPNFEVKGWCPGALRPMESGDGLIVRLSARGAGLSRAAMQGIAAAAESFGNGHRSHPPRQSANPRSESPDACTVARGAARARLAGCECRGG